MKVGKFYRVVKAKDAVKGPSPTFIDGRMNEVPYDERMVTVLHKLRHLDGDNLLKVLKKMVSPAGSVQIVPPRFADLGYGDERPPLDALGQTPRQGGRDAPDPLLRGAVRRRRRPSVQAR